MWKNIFTSLIIFIALFFTQILWINLLNLSIDTFIYLGLFTIIFLVFTKGKIPILFNHSALLITFLLFIQNQYNDITITYAFLFGSQIFLLLLMFILRNKNLKKVFTPVFTVSLLLGMSFFYSKYIVFQTFELPYDFIISGTLPTFTLFPFNDLYLNIDLKTIAFLITSIILYSVLQLTLYSSIMNTKETISSRRLNKGLLLQTLLNIPLLIIGLTPIQVSEWTLYKQLNATMIVIISFLLIGVSFIYTTLPLTLLSPYALVVLVLYMLYEAQKIMKEQKINLSSRSEYLVFICIVLPFIFTNYFLVLTSFLLLAIVLKISLKQSTLDTYEVLSKDTLSTLLDLSHYGLFVVLNKDLLVLNKQLIQQFDLEEKSEQTILLSEFIDRIKLKDHRKLFNEQLNLLFNNEITECRCTIIMEDLHRKEYYYDLYFRAYIYLDETIYIGHSIDVTEIKNNEATIKKLTLFDTLTDVYNRSMFYRMIKDKKDGYGIFINLDDYKVLNYKSGFEVGDYCLMIVAKRIKTLVFGCGEVFRINGDEFFVHLTLNSLYEVEAVVKDLLDNIAMPILYQGEELKVTASIGIANRMEYKELEEFYYNAYNAMIKAKNTGKNQYILTSILNRDKEL